MREKHLETKKKRISTKMKKREKIRKRKEALSLDAGCAEGKWEELKKWIWEIIRK